MKDEESKSTKPTKPWRARRKPRPLKVEAVPAKKYPKDSAERLQVATMPFIAGAIKELITQGKLVEIDGKLVRTKSAKPDRDATTAKEGEPEERDHHPLQAERDSKPRAKGSRKNRPSKKK